VSLVIDASAAIALVLREPASRELDRAIRSSVERLDRLMVPEAFWLELVNVLIRRHRLAHHDVVAALRELDELGLESVHSDRALLLVAIDRAGRTGLSAYDAMYLALAEVEDARLLTLDRRLAEAAGPRALRLASLGPTRLAEPAMPYESEPVDWARFGRYLADLRARVAAGR
jgi:predicted nucleic acid-binding protein